MSRIAESLKLFLPQLAERTNEARQALADLRDRQNALKAERSTLLHTGLGREDFADVMLADIDRAADLQMEGFAKHIVLVAGGRPGRGDPMATFDAALRLETRPGDVMRLPLANPFKTGFSDSLNTTEFLRMGAALRLFREQVKEATKAAILAVENWPMENTRPLAEMRQRLAAIDIELATIAEEIDEIRAVADQVGADLSGSYEPVKAETPVPHFPKHEPPAEWQSAAYHRERAEEEERSGRSKTAR